jgi:hypothetical protein
MTGVILMMLPIGLAGDPPTTAPVERPDEMITDRPDFTESPFAVAPHRVQLEMGYTFAYSSDGGDRRTGQTIGVGLVRVGLVDRLELRIDVPSIELLSRNPGDDDAGVSDSGLGIKLELAEQDGWIPSLGLIVAASLPTGSDPFSLDTVVPAVTFAWSYSLGDVYTLSGNFGIANPADEAGRFTEGSASLSLGAELAERVGCYAEYYVILASGGRDEAHNINGGLTYMVTDDLQLDFRVGAGLSDAADDVFAGVGFARRW